MKPVKTAVIGCGAISDIYLSNMIHKYATLDVVACCASHRENAEKKAAQYGIRAASTDEILADPAVELIVVLTPAPSHYELVKRALMAGKHVYTEKPIATEHLKAQELLALSKEKGLLLGAAPETFMGSAVQTARKALDEGLIGELTSFHIVANRDLTVLASFAKFLRQPGGGICYDYGVYYLTALVSLLGPVESVFARVGNHSRMRKNVIPDSPEFGQEYIYDNEAQVNAILTTKSGIVGTFSLNGDSAAVDQGNFTIHGTKGILRLGDANQFGGEIAFLPDDYFRAAWQTLEPVSELSDNCRGLGVADMARCIREGGRPRVSAEMPCHVLDIVEKIMESGRSGQACTTETVCERPAVLEDWNTLIR
ncbi:MAG: Gfo/Idh/MocA family oxidoreductase [Oscillospiraceae bacterium]|nr:Gfo/Idh/MocA family oxidoreductase [Oscillospiraceae bacterium]